MTWIAHGFAERLAAEFWADTGLAGEFPRPIERAVAMELPLAIIKLPALSAGLVRRWLDHRGLRAEFPDDGRDLMGYLYTHRGNGYVFVCGADGPEEQRLTVAHETAHFLLDYLLPRRRVIAALGPAADAVLDGDRAPAFGERATALLSHVRLGPHVHLLPRAGTDEDCDAPVAAAEARADVLALELVAPRERIAGQLWRLAGATESIGADAATAGLGSYFGLPPDVFRPIVRSATRPQRSPLLSAAMAAARRRRQREREPT